MPLVINTNVAALNAQRQLVSSGNDMSEAMERLSSGRRINTAADDAAGLAISNRQTSQIRGLTQAVRNANDGVSLIQTAEGALDESTNVLQRMRELSIQAANGIYSDADRETLDAEFQQLVDELDRIAETTSFNGQNLLDGSLGNVDLQVGAEANQTIDFSIQAMDTQVLGLGSTSSDLAGARTTDLLNLDAAAGTPVSFGDSDVLINNQSIGSFDGATETVQDLLDNINLNVDGVSAQGFNIAEAGTVGSGAIQAGDTLTISLFDVDGPSTAKTDFTFTSSNSMTELVDDINNKMGSLLRASVNDAGGLVLSNDTGAAFALSYDNTGSTTDTLSDVIGFTDNSVLDQGGVNSANDQFIVGADDAALFTGSISLISDTGEDISVTLGPEGTVADLNNLGFQQAAGNGTVLGVSNDAVLPAGTVDFSEGLETGDLNINGVVIEATVDDSLQGVIDTINNATSETNVVASSQAQLAFDESTQIPATEFISGPGAVNITGGQNLEVNGVTTANFAGTALSDVADAFNAVSDTSGVTAFVDDNNQLHLFSAGPIVVDNGSAAIADLGGLENAYVAPGTPLVAGTAVADVTLDNATTPGASDIVINGQSVSLTDLSDLTQVVADLNVSEAQTGVHAEIDDNGELSLSSSSNISIQLGSSRSAMTAAHAIGVADLISDSDSVTPGYQVDTTFTVGAAIRLTSINETAISVEGNVSAQTATGLLNQNTQQSSAVTGSAISNVNIATGAAAQASIDPIDNALETINSIRSDLGAINNRLEFTMSNLSNISENTAAARSRIVDADFAAETANLSRAQVLQQASQAMLAQANAQPQQVLQLLQG